MKSDCFYQLVSGACLDLRAVVMVGTLEVSREREDRDTLQAFASVHIMFSGMVKDVVLASIVRKGIKEEEVRKEIEMAGELERQRLIEAWTKAS